MQDLILTRERVLDAARDVVRRHGPSKASVVDVAEALGVSHGSIYRFFPSKAALREAVVGQWVSSLADAVERRPLEGSSADRLLGWFMAFRDEKRRQRDAEPELFEAFRVLSPLESGAIQAYKDRLADQIATLLKAGVATGEFRDLDPRSTARALLNATLRFHHPEFADQWAEPSADEDFQTLWALLAQGISSERKPL